MPIQPNLLERFAFFNLNAAPTPMLDLAGALSFQVLSTAVHLNIFNTLQARPYSLSELTQTLDCQKRGLQKLLSALVALGYVTEKNGRYHNSVMTEKWFLNESTLDLYSAITCWDAFLRELWPHAPEVVQSGKRPYDFYQFTASTPGLSHAHQQMMSGNANIMAPDIIKQIKLPQESVKLLDVGGGHGMFTIHFCQAHPNLQATIFDDATALETAKINIAAHHLENRIDLKVGNIWEVDWGEGHDLLLLFNFIHHFDMETNIKVLQKAQAALKPNGKVAILDQLEGNVLGSATSTLIKLMGFMYYLFANGRTFSREEVNHMLNNTGFKEIKYHTSAKWAGTSLVIATK